jgi:hypothetical protein
VTVALTIPDAYATVILGVTLTGLLTWLAYMVRTTQRTAELLRETAAELRDHDRRLARLEGWQDAMQFHRAAEDHADREGRS